MATFFIALGVFCAVYFPLGFLIDGATQYAAYLKKRRRYALASCRR